MEIYNRKKTSAPLQVAKTTDTKRDLMVFWTICYNCPRVWRTKPKKEIADDLKGRLLDRMLDRVEGYLEEEHSRKTDPSKIQTYDVSFYVDTCSDEYSPYLDKVEITVEGLCTTPDVKKLSFHGTFSGPDLKLVSCLFESTSLNDREYS